MKRCLSVLLALLLALSLCACGQQSDESSQGSPAAATQPSGGAPSQDAVADDPGHVPAAAPETQPEPSEAASQPSAPPKDPAIPEVEVVVGMPHFFLDEGDQLVTLAVLNTVLPQCDSLPQINAYYETMRVDLISTYGLNTEDAARQRQELEQAGLEFTPWDIRVDSQITRSDGATLSVLRTVTEDWPEHETVRYQAETFDLASQGRLVLGDLFTVGEEQYLPRLSAEAGVVDALNFALTGDSLVLCTPQGTVTFPLAGLADILQPRWITQ